MDKNNSQTISFYEVVFFLLKFGFFIINASISGAFASYKNIALN
jgi:hypothetical protein